MKRTDFAEADVAAWSKLMGGENLSGVGSTQRLLWSGRLVEAVLDRVAKDLGFRNRGDYEVAAVIRRSEPELLTAIDVARVLMISPSGMTGRLDRLENQGFLVRLFDKRDRRVVRLQLTTAGREAVDAAFASNVALYEKIFSSLSQRDRETLDRLLGSLLNGLEDFSIDS